MPDANDPAVCPDPDTFPDLSPEQRERARDIDTALAIIGYMQRDYPAPLQAFGYVWPSLYVEQLYECDWEHGVCQCPDCGAIVCVQGGNPARVLDLDRRVHHCQRVYASTWHRHGYPHRRELTQYAERPVVPREPAPNGRQPPVHRGSGL